MRVTDRRTERPWHTVRCITCDVHYMFICAYLYRIQFLIHIRNTGCNNNLHVRTGITYRYPVLHTCTQYWYARVNIV